VIQLAKYDRLLIKNKRKDLNPDVLNAERLPRAANSCRWMPLAVVAAIVDQAVSENGGSGRIGFCEGPTNPAGEMKTINRRLALTR
jgi:hypothetical protein